MPLLGAGGVLPLEYHHPPSGERHSLRLHVAHFDPTPIVTAYGINDRAYIGGGPVVPTETSVCQTYHALVTLWQAYYSPSWVISLLGLQQLNADTLTALTPAPIAVPVAGLNVADNDGGLRATRRIRLLGQTGAVRHLWLSQVAGSVQPESPVEVGPSTGGMDARDRAWMAYLSGNAGGGAVMPDGTYCFPVTDMRVEWARPLLAASWVTPGAPYLVSGQ